MGRVFEWQLVESEDWFDKIVELHSGGFTYFDFLTGVDRENGHGDPGFEVVAHLAKPDLSDSLIIFTRVDIELASVTDLIPAASWHERECAEMFGIEFTGVATKPLLRHEDLGQPPLCKSTVLAARVLTPWPGGAELEIMEDGRKVGNASRRRQRPPGVPENWLSA